MKVAIFGAAGAMGHAVLDAALARGHSVRVVGRRREVLEKEFGGKAEVVGADLATDEGARAAARGCDAVVYAVGLPYSRKTFSTYPPMMRTAVAALKAEGVRKLLLVATVYSYGRPRGNPVREDHPREPCSVKGRFRKEQEDVALAAHDPGGLQVLVLRMPDFIGPLATGSFPYVMLQGARRGRADLIGPIDTPHEFIFVPDAGRVIVQLLERDDVWGGAFHLAGPGVTTMRRVAELIFQELGRPPRFRVAGRTVLRVMGLVNPLVRELVEMHYLQSDPILLDDAKLRARLGPIDRTSYEEAVRHLVAG